MKKLFYLQKHFFLADLWKSNFKNSEIAPELPSFLRYCLFMRSMASKAAPHPPHTLATTTNRVFAITPTQELI